MRMVKVLEVKPYEEQLRSLGTDVFILKTSDRIHENGRKLSQVRFRLDITKRFLHPESVWALEQAPQGSDHSTKPDRVQEAFGQYFQAHGVTLGVSCAGPGVGLDDSDESLPTQHVL
ncbi:hypothetical protein HGM15179_003283 [Zosterops borbonicus]|uniref:Uncharacterized protein n=1 Tax=Zosterops borbonicus TaxID=364589 RepID=A0A8K1GTK2_9PASS|nr:hypothetical protein HGM15179_003283 [Zosterops borbonicus]